MNYCYRRALTTLLYDSSTWIHCLGIDLFAFNINSATHFISIYQPEYLDLDN